MNGGRANNFIRLVAASSVFIVKKQFKMVSIALNFLLCSTKRMQFDSEKMLFIYLSNLKQYLFSFLMTP